MTATLIPFPCGRLAGKIRRVALMTFDGAQANPPPGRSYAHSSAYDRRLKADLRKSMERIGIDAETIDRELLAFTLATVDEIQRLCRLERETNEEARRGRDGGRRITPHDGGDAA